MELRFFQIIVPCFVLVLVLRQVYEFRKANATAFETILISIFWIAIAVFVLSPDYFSKKVARFFEIKDRVNAIILLALGLLFYFQFQYLI